MQGTIEFRIHFFIGRIAVLAIPPDWSTVQEKDTRGVGATSVGMASRVAHCPRRHHSMIDRLKHAGQGNGRSDEAALTL